MRRKTIAGAVLLAAGLLPLALAEGMWMPQQVPALSAELEGMGLKMAPERLADLTGDPMGAIVSLGGCSASFVSPEGLIVTNHHCVYGYLQYNSTAERNLLEKGFLARTRTEEIPASPDARVYVTTAIEDVSARIAPAEGEKLSDLQRRERTERRKKAVVAECEKEPGTRCLVASFFEGTEYWQVRQLEIRDVRLVYAPARAIGNYGGEVDNWMWPRHTGDFGFLRAYVGPNGKPADPARENVPYRPERYLRVSTSDVDPGDLMLTIGYPGKTYRYKLAEEVKDAEEFELPKGVEYRRELIRILEERGKTDREAAIRNASRVRGLANYLKKFQGTIEAFEKGALLESRRGEEKDLIALLARDPASRSRYEAAMAEIARLNSAKRATRERDAILEWLVSSSPMLSQANALLLASRERQKEDLDRRSGYQERDRKKLEAQLRRAQRQIEPSSDRAGLRFFLLEAARLPQSQRIPVLDQALASTGERDPERQVERLLDEIYRSTQVGDLEERLEMLQQKPEQLLARKDSMLAFASRLRDAMDAVERRNDEIEGAMLRLRPVYVEALRKKREGRLYPDANGTLRVSFGRVEGYSPRDSVQFAAQTTLRGIREKDTGREPFDSPGVLLAASREREAAPYADPELGDVPVNFLSASDITNGSSGSATLNASGELAGLAFDGNYEAMGSDFLVNPQVSRAIHVDSRYMLWVMDAIDGAHNLIREMGLPVRFPGRGRATSRTASP
jgi:hypothetical protein